MPMSYFLAYTIGRPHRSTASTGIEVVEQH